MRALTVDKGRMVRESREVLKRLKINIPRAVQQGGRLVFMDEPTAALGVQEQGKVLRLIEDLKADGTAVVVVSHNLQHVFHVADRIVVMHRGRNAGQRLKTEATAEEIVGLIVGAPTVLPVGTA